jgi:hypothetical protein
LRTRVGGDFPAMVRNVHATVMDAFVRQSVPYHTLTLARPSGAGHRADDVVFQMIAEPMERTTLAGAEAEIVIPDAIGSRFELELSLVLREGRLTGVLFYNAARLAPDWARELVAGFAALAAEVACQ